MQVHKLADMRGGWFVGNFQPHVLFSTDMEVAVKRYRQGDKEAAHVHRIAVELTVCVSGSFRMTPVDPATGEMGNSWLVYPGDIIELDPGDAVAFEAVTDCICCVVKSPSVQGDKHPV